MKYLKLVLVAIFCLSVVACTAAKQNSATTSASMEWRIKSLEESFLNFREKQRLEADQAIQNQENIDKRFKLMEDKINAVKDGEAVVVIEEPADAPPLDEEWVTDLKPEEESWVEGQKTQGEAPVAQSSEDKPWAKVPGPPSVIPEPKVIKRSSAKVSKKVTKPKRAISGAQSMYDKGLEKYNSNDFEGARGIFDQFIKKYPKDKLLPNALYWKGETYYSQKDFTQAILTFKEVTGRFPKHAKSASALLKIGMSYDMLDDSDNAVFYLRALIEDFPGSSPAKLARKELSRLGG